MATPITIFYSYARTDERLRKQLEKHLSLLRQQGIVTEWHDRQVVPGSNWAQEIDHRLSTATIILLLVSPDFLASEYCYSVEMQRALDRHQAGNACVVPILLRPVDLAHAPFAMLQCLPSDGKAVTLWRNRDEAFRDVVEGIRKAIELLQTSKGFFPHSPEQLLAGELLAALTIEVGASIAKLMLKLWLKDFAATADDTTTIMDILRAKLDDRIAQKRTQRQFEAIGERIGESLFPIFEAYNNLHEGSHTTVALTVAEVLNTVAGDTMAQFNGDPSSIAKHLLKEYPATNYRFNKIETMLYQRVIVDACTYIVDIVSQLPPFHKSISVEMLKREDQILGIANEILQEVSRLRQRLNLEEKDAQETTHFELEYRRAVLRNLDTLQLFGTDVANSSRRHRLSVAYVMLSVEQKAWEVRQQKKMQPQAAMSYRDLRDATFVVGGPEDDTALIVGGHHLKPKKVYEEIIQALGDPRKDLKEQAVIIQAAAKSVMSVDEALVHSHRLVVQGLAGSGKTTLLQWLAVTAASQTFQATLDNWNDKLPFYIRLRSCVQSGLPMPEDFPKFTASSVAGLAPKGWVHTKLISGNALLLIDGLDEIPVAQREDVRNWLKDLVEAFPNATFILTSRPHALDEGWIDLPDFKLAELQPMMLSDIDAFIDHWHAAVEEEVAYEEEKAELLLLARHLKGEVQQDRSKRDLATNPLLCSMLCALNRERRQNLPSDRIELYEASCQMLIERRDKERRVSLTDYPAHTLTYRQKRSLLEDFAYWLIKNGWPEVELHRADERFTKQILNMHNISPDIVGSHVLHLFLERTSIVREVVAGHISFTHRTFQEFLAAHAVLDEGDIGVLIEHAHNDQWWETIILFCGLATKKAREELLRGLVERGDAEQEQRYPLHMLAIACLETSIELELTVKQDIQQCLSELVPPKNIEEAKALAKAGELAVPHLAYNPQYPPSVLAACAFALVHIGSEAALDALDEYLYHPTIEVIIVLLNAKQVFDVRVYAHRILRILLENVAILSKVLTSLDGFQYLTDLKTLDLSDCKHIKDLTPLAKLSQLTHLKLAGCRRVASLAPLAKLSQLTHLDLAECEQVTSLVPLAKLSRLTHLNLTNCSRIKNLAPLAKLTNLIYLDLTECGNAYNFSSLRSLTALVYLDLTRCAKVKDIVFLAGLVQLTHLSLAGCWQVIDLTPLKGLTQLTLLDLALCWQIKNLESLSGLAELVLLNLSYCDNLNDLVPLSSLKKLERLEVHGTLQEASLARE